MTRRSEHDHLERLGFLGGRHRLRYVSGDGGRDRSAGDDRFYQAQAWPLALALALSGVIIWGLGKYLHARGARVVIDKATGQELTIGGQHRFFFIPMHHWGPVLIALSVLPFLIR